MYESLRPALQKKHGIDTTNSFEFLKIFKKLIGIELIFLESKTNSRSF